MGRITNTPAHLQSGTTKVYQIIFAGSPLLTDANSVLRTPPKLSVNPLQQPKYPTVNFANRCNAPFLLN